MAKIKLPRLHFRKQPRETGLAAVGNPDPCTDILLDRKIVGWIQAPNWQRWGGWQIWLHVAREPTSTDKSPFQNRMLKGEHETEPAARAWLKEHWDKITAAHKLHQLEE